MTIDTFYKNDQQQDEILKDPNEVLDYGFNWADYLATTGDSIASQVEVVQTGITMTGASVLGAIHVVNLSGGTLGEVYRIQSRITTLLGRVANRSIYVKIQDR